MFEYLKRWRFRNLWATRSNRSTKNKFRNSLYVIELRSFELCKIKSETIASRCFSNISHKRVYACIPTRNRPNRRGTLPKGFVLLTLVPEGDGRYNTFPCQLRREGDWKRCRRMKLFVERGRQRILRDERGKERSSLEMLEGQGWFFVDAATELEVRFLFQFSLSFSRSS